MRAADIEECIHSYLLAKAQAMGQGTAFMEPLVVLSKIRRVKIDKETTDYGWQNTLLLRVIRHKEKDGHWTWTLVEPDGSHLAVYSQTL